MQLTLGEILTQLFNTHGVSYSPSSEDAVTVRNQVNFIQDNICDRLKYWWRKELKEFETIAAYTTGTITIATASGVSTVTGTDTVFTLAMVGRRFIVSGETTAYRVASYTSATSITLDRIYINPSDRTNTLSDDSSYYIAQDRFLMDRDFASFVYQTIRNIDEETSLTVMTDVEFDQKYPAPYEVDDPTIAVIRGLTQSAFYNTGTITIATAGGVSTVTGTNTVFTSDMVGKTFRIKNDSREYTIATYVSETSLTISPQYVNPNNLTNTLSVATAYEIDPPGNVIVELYPFPLYQTHIKGWAYCKLPKLVEDSDISLIPDHKALMSGSQWQMDIYKRQKDTVIAGRLAEYESDIYLLKSTIPAIQKQPRIKVRVREAGTT